MRKITFGDIIIANAVIACVCFCLFTAFKVPEPEAIDVPAYDEARWGSKAAWLHFTEAQRLCDGYGIELKMWSWPKKAMHVHIPSDHFFATGTDSACQSFGIMCVRLLDIYDDGWILEVTGDFVPSAKMPIDLKWAKYLAEGY